MDELQSIVDVTPWLAPVFVFEAFEGRGAAAQLIEAVEDEARRRSHQYLHLITDHHQQFYKRRGWQTIDDARLAVGLDFSLMQKRVIDARPLWSLPSDQRIALAEQLAVWDHEEFAYFFTEFRSVILPDHAVVLWEGHRCDPKSFPRGVEVARMNEN